MKGLTSLKTYTSGMWFDSISPLQVNTDMIRIHFYKPRGLFGKLVTFSTGELFSHVTIEHQLFDQPVISQADPVKGVMVSRVDSMTVPDYTVDIPWISGEDAVYIMSRYWGVEYGWRDVVLFKFRPKWLVRRNHKGIMCSELVALVLIDADNMLLTPKDHEGMLGRLTATQPSDISPGALAKILTGWYP